MIMIFKSPWNKSLQQNLAYFSYVIILKEKKKKAAGAYYTTPM